MRWLRFDWTLLMMHVLSVPIAGIEMREAGEAKFLCAAISTTVGG